ncbi:hypothetical protein F2Q70_00032359 [Brassica cretica]|uniref:Uncharacterized protein n=1 Tax=Brassica cretica TaxID=69181 RepID=A0A8S9FGH3_BRACR|nr:hypothetical protein F2Q70_00032359 [Brassica cretica]
MKSADFDVKKDSKGRYQPSCLPLSCFRKSSSRKRSDESSIKLENEIACKSFIKCKKVRRRKALVIPVQTLYSRGWDLYAWAFKVKKRIQLVVHSLMVLP